MAIMLLTMERNYHYSYDILLAMGFNPGELLNPELLEDSNEVSF